MFFKRRKKEFTKVETSSSPRKPQTVQKEEKPVAPQKTEPAKKVEKPAAPRKAEPAKKAEKPAATKKTAPTKKADKSSARGGRPSYHVVKRDDGKWEVKFAGGKKAIKLFDTQAEAVEFTRKMANNQDGAMLVHNSKGKNKGKIKSK